MSDNIHLLAGAYALDALPLEERAFFERHLASCEPCRHEVEEYREVAASLGAATAEAPPASLRDRVLAEVENTRQVSPLPARSQTLRERLQPHLAAVAVALAAAVISLGGVSVYLWETRQDAGVLALDEDFLAAAETVRLDAPEGTEAKFLYAPDRDEGYLVISGLETLDAEQDYQLWLFHDGTPVPAGVLTLENGKATFRAEAPVQGAELVAVTIEQAGGLPEPSGPVLLSAQL